eukprot:2772027-Rhodomonas_salina.4
MQPNRQGERSQRQMDADRGVQLCAMLDQVLSTQISVRARSLGRLSGHRVVSRKLHQLLVGDVPSWAARHRPLEESHKLLRMLRRKKT